MEYLRSLTIIFVTWCFCGSLCVALIGSFAFFGAPDYMELCDCPLFFIIGGLSFNAVTILVLRDATK